MIWAPRLNGVKNPVEIRRYDAEGELTTPSFVVISRPEEHRHHTGKVSVRGITPFGLPVVPEVKISDATDCICTRCGNKAIRSSSVSSSGIANTSSKVQSLAPWPALARSSVSFG